MLKISTKQTVKAVCILVFVFILGSTIAIARSEARLVSSPVLQAAPTPDPGDNWGNEKISAHRLWQSGYTGDDVVVAVIDTGIDDGHPTFAGTNAIRAAVDTVADQRDGRGIGIESTDPTGDPFLVHPDDPRDYQGHGTSMASLIAAPFVDGRIRGVAYESRIVSIKVMYLGEYKRQVAADESIAPYGERTIEFEMAKSGGSQAADALDFILTWASNPDLELEVISPPTPVYTYSADQSGTEFTAATNLPLQARFGHWQARVTNSTGQSQTFSLTVKQWRWQYRAEELWDAIDYAINHNDVTVINIALETGPALDEKIQEAIDEGIIVVTAAGNDNDLTSWYRREITTGATDDTDTLADWSARGPAPTPAPAGVANTKPDVVAPGVHTCAASSRYSFSSQNLYPCISGSSPAAAHVSGAAALLIHYLREMTGQYPSPALVKSILMGTAVDVGVGGPPAHPNELEQQKDNDVGAGRIDLYRALLSFGLSGTAGPQAFDVDEVTLQTPGNLPNTPATPLKGTLYWDTAPFEGFRLTGGDVSSAAPDTAMNLYATSAPGPHAFKAHRWDANAGDPWYFVSTHPPIRQYLDEQLVLGYFAADVVLPAHSFDSLYTILVPQTAQAGLRVVAYPGSDADIWLYLQDPSGQQVAASRFADVSIEQVETAFEPDGGEWSLEIWNIESQDVAVTLVSNYPFDFSLPEKIYLPTVRRHHQ